MLYKLLLYYPYGEKLQHMLLYFVELFIWLYAIYKKSSRSSWNDSIIFNKKVVHTNEWSNICSMQNDPLFLILHGRQQFALSSQHDFLADKMLLWLISCRLETFCDVTVSKNHGLKKLQFWNQSYVVPQFRKKMSWFKFIKF